MVNLLWQRQNYCTFDNNYYNSIASFFEIELFLPGMIWIFYFLGKNNKNICLKIFQKIMTTLHDDGDENHQICN